MKTLTGKLKEAEARAEHAEKTVKKLQKEVDRLEGIFTNTLISITFRFISINMKKTALFKIKTNINNNMNFFVVSYNLIEEKFEFARELQEMLCSDSRAGPEKITWKSTDHFGLGSYFQGQI